MLFFAQDIYGSHRFSDIFNGLWIPSAKRHAQVAKFFDVSPRTLQRWLTGKSEPPRAVVYALWHESHEGRAVTASHSENGYMYERNLARCLGETIDKLRMQVTALESELDAIKRESVRPLAMNQPMFYKA